MRKTDGTGKGYSQDAPGHGSVSEFFQKVDADPEWFPGKVSGQKRGRKAVMTPAKRPASRLLQ